MTSLRRVRRRLAAGAFCLVVALRAPHAAAQEPAPASEPASAAFELDYDPGAPDVDPFESTNRAVFEFNRALDFLLFDPISRGYRFVMPEPGRRAVLRFFNNLKQPVSAVNHLLQLDPREAAASTGRFALNSTFGMLGFFDAAERVCLESEDTDFGETLAVAGVGAGPYLVMPVLGPTTARDAFGNLVDGFLLFQTWIFGATEGLALVTGAGISQREAADEQLDELEKSSVDFYAALRSAYLMDRRAEIERHRTGAGARAGATGATHSCAPGVFVPKAIAGLPDPSHAAKR